MGRIGFRRRCSGDHLQHFAHALPGALHQAAVDMVLIPAGTDLAAYFVLQLLQALQLLGSEMGLGQRSGIQAAQVVLAALDATQQGDDLIFFLQYRPQLFHVSLNKGSAFLFQHASQALTQIATYDEQRFDVGEVGRLGVGFIVQSGAQDA